MANIILTILTSAGISAILYAGLIWLTKTWISERLKGAIQHEYNEKIENLKAQLKSEYDLRIEVYKGQLNAGLETLRSDLTGHRFLLESAIKSQAFSHDLFHQKRITAVERLWAVVLELRERLSSPVFFFGILLPSEYDSVLEKGDAIAASIAAITDETIHAAIKPTSELEADRLHLGETLWFQFFIYRAFLARLASLIVQGKRRQLIPDWRDDSGVRQLLSQIIPEDTLGELLNSKHNPIAIRRTVDILESLLLKEISLITSGRRSSFESFENAKELQAALAGLRPNGV